VLSLYGVGTNKYESLIKAKSDSYGNKLEASC